MHHIINFPLAVCIFSLALDIALNFLLQASTVSVAAYMDLGNDQRSSILHK
jgi:hypothetical protein